MRYDQWKTFPYPVLRPLSDDYLEAKLRADTVPTVWDKALSVEIKMDFTLKDADSLRELLDAGKAEYAALLVSRDTYFRELIRSAEPTFSKVFEGGKLKGRVEVYPFILATKDIPDYVPEGIHPEFGGDPFSIENGDVIALDEATEFWVEQDYFASLNSVIELVEADDVEMGRVEVGLDSDMMQIKVNPRQKKLLDSWRGQANLRPVLFNSIYLPAVMDAIRAMSQSSDYEDEKWHKAFTGACAGLGEEIEEGVDCLDVAQKLLKSPLEKLNGSAIMGGV